MARVARYGSWASPITADVVAADAVVLSEIAVEGADLYWTELRPREGGRKVLLRRGSDGDPIELTPPRFNARTCVHEYGGGDFSVFARSVFFANFSDQRLYRVDPGTSPEAVTPPGAYRYADGVADGARRRIICAFEDHTPGERSPRNTLAAVPMDGGPARVLVEGSDFYCSPRLSPDGTRLAWLSWNHPNMPWDGTELWIAAVEPDGSVVRPLRVAGGSEESIFQPEWSPDGQLYFVSDRTEWWNLYRWDEDRQAAVALAPMQAEFGRPQWSLRSPTYGFLGAQTIICVYAARGVRILALLYLETGRLEPLDLPYTDFAQITPAQGGVYFIAASPTAPAALMHLDVNTRETAIIRRASVAAVDAGYLSLPQAIEFPTAGARTAHAWYYPPANKDFDGPREEPPPLLVVSHGGPTSFSPGVLRLEFQFWTSRGFAIVDVNYGGSTGYGRSYRNRLRGQWGVVDVDDCVSAAMYLAERGVIDPRRMAIRGGSAGGFTTLSALAFRDVFQAGASYYGVSDLEAMHRETHKFEAQYDQQLVGAWPARADLYRARSPLRHAGRIRVPVIFFQGLEDKIVPPNQSEMMVDTLRAAGTPVAYLAFAGEQHGFRRAETITRTLEAELYFYCRWFGFTPADRIPPVPIDNDR